MRRYALLLAATVIAAACTNELPSSFEEDAVIGTYKLSTLGGKALPGLLASSETVKREVLSATIFLKADHKCSADFTYRDTANGVANTHEEKNPCTFDVHDTFLTLNLTEARATQSGTIESGTIRVTD